MGARLTARGHPHKDNAQPFIFERRYAEGRNERHAAHAAASPLYDEAARAAPEYADCMTISGRDIAGENASSTFNRALRIPSQGPWKRS